MNYNVNIQNRKSVRAFTDEKVPVPIPQYLNTYFRSSVKRLVPELKTELLILREDVKEALEGAAGYNSFLVGAPQYLVLLSEKSPLAHLNAGYIMEDLILHLTDFNMSSCWVTFTDSELVKKSVGISSDLDVAAIVAFGYGEKTTRRLRLNFKSMSNVDIVAKHRYMEPKRSIRELVYLNSWGNNSGLEEHIGFYDNMLWESFYAASLSPSYLNRQAYGFLIHDGGISLVSRPDELTPEADRDLSLGAVMLHFSAVLEGWLGKLSWRLGKDAASHALPEGHSVVATLAL